MNHLKRTSILAALALAGVLVSSCNNALPVIVPHQSNPNPNPNPGEGATPTPTPSPAPAKNCQTTYVLFATLVSQSRRPVQTRNFYLQTEDSSLQLIDTNCPFTTADGFTNFPFAVGHYIGPAPVSFTAWQPENIEPFGGALSLQAGTGGLEQPAGNIDVFGISFKKAVLFGSILTASESQLTFTAAYPVSAELQNEACHFSSEVTDGVLVTQTSPERVIPSNLGPQGSNSAASTTYNLTAFVTLSYEHDTDVSGCLDIVLKHLGP